MDIQYSQYCWYPFLLNRFVKEVHTYKTGPKISYLKRKQVVLQAKAARPLPKTLDILRLTRKADLQQRYASERPMSYSVPHSIF